ncbi:ADP-ribosylation factor-like protein 6 [Bactrocera dorsalis]|uniref:ADP-ribosylation factor-like protein 6 n=1 Tax=Bactrocera dorsalis TaxID=27457 RepID=A0ABM3JKT7_BACDO|nr:ADP-ribosylation factor-like protein 6 [Bactrocera dorsalis]
MGMFKKISTFFKNKSEKVTILVIGLNNSGKSTIINHFKSPHEQAAITVPTVGFSLEQIRSEGVLFTMVDTSGAWRYRSLWEHHFKNCHGIIYVIDSSDRMRLVVVRDELDTLLQHPDLVNRSIPILLYNNKVDCEDSLSSVKIAAALGLHNIVDKPWHITPSNAVTGEGLEDGVHWLVQQIKSMNSNNKKLKR